MNTEDLQKLGLSDEQIKSVMAAHGQVVNPLKETVNSLTAERDNLNEQVTTVNGQLEEIKKNNDSDDLKAQIQQLQDKNKQDAKEYQAKLSENKISYLTELALTKAGAKNVKAARALLDGDKLQLDDDGKLTGLDEQLESIKSDNDFLFQSDEPAQPKAPNISIHGNPNPLVNGGESIVEKIQNNLSKK